MKYLYFFLVTILLFACKKEENKEELIPNPPPHYTICYDTLDVVGQLAFYPWVLDSGYYETNFLYQGVISKDRGGDITDSVIFIYHPSGPELINISKGDSISRIMFFGGTLDSIHAYNNFEFIYFSKSTAARNRTLNLDITLTDSNHIEVDTYTDWALIKPGHGMVESRNAAKYFLSRKNFPKCR